MNNSNNSYKFTAGQIVNEPAAHKHLSDYIRSINRAQAFDDVASEKKLTFEEWWATNHGLIQITKFEAGLVWNAAKDNK